MTHRTYRDASATVEENEFVWVVVWKIVDVNISKVVVLGICGGAAGDGGGARMQVIAC